MNFSTQNRIYLFGFFKMFMPIIPLMVPYLLSLGITMEEFFQLQAIFGVSVATLEVPSGYLSDHIQIKTTLFYLGLAFAFAFISVTIPLILEVRKDGLQKIPAT